MVKKTVIVEDMEAGRGVVESVNKAYSLQLTANMGIQKFRKLTIWQRSMSFIGKIYLETNSYPKNELYGLIDQTRRAATSIALNIAEGSGSGSDKEFRRFLYIALRSVYEVITGLEIAMMLKYGDMEKQKLLIQEADEIVAMIHGFIKTLSNQ